VCFRVNDNVAASTATSSFGLLLAVTGGTVDLEKKSGVTASDAPTVLAQNNPGTSVSSVSASGTIAVVNPGSCNVAST
jgi:hypothetical protein